MSKLNLKESMKSGLGGTLKVTTSRDNPLKPTQVDLEEAIQAAKARAVPAPAPKEAAEKKTKAEQFTERVTLVISHEQRGMIEEIAWKVQRNGVKKPERITANTVMRCLVNLLDGFDADLSRVTDENSLNELIRKHFSK